jgi:putative oxidoreductase
MARALSLPAVARFRDAAPFVLRGGVGVIFVYHGYQKLDNGISNFEGFVRLLELPIPAVTAQVVTWLELVGGILLILGALTRVVSLLFVLEMIGTTFYVKLYKLELGLIGEMATGAEIDVALLVGAMALVFLGPGWAALDRILGIERPPALVSSASVVSPAPATSGFQG